MKLFNLWFRLQACRMTALAMHDCDRDLVPFAWCLTVFFEEYLRKGAEGTREDFGPKDAPVVHIIKPGQKRES